MSDASGPPTLTRAERARLLGLRALAAGWRAGRGDAISAMVRVRNEEEFLRAAIESIVDLVDEVVVADNRSSDASPAIIAALAREHPGKITVHDYPWAVRRIGRETHELAASPATRSSPHLSASFYNWCLERTTKPFVLKWDGDMIALPSLSRAIADWRRSRRPILIFRGENVHPDRTHLLEARCRDRAELERRYGVARLPSWSSDLTHDAAEPRLFPRVLAQYDTAVGFTQSLASPFADSRFKAALRHVEAEPCFLHMKFCKRDPFANYDEAMARAIAANAAVGPPIGPAGRSILRRLGAGETAA